MEYNRDKDGKFAPKGTGDKTGFEKGFHKAMPKNPAPKEVKLPFGEKPRLEDVQSDLYDIMNAEYDDDRHEGAVAADTYYALLDAANKADPEEAEALKKEAEAWKDRSNDLLGLTEEISEALMDNEWTVTPDVTVGKYAEEVAEKIGATKHEVLREILKSDPKASESEKMADVIARASKVPSKPAKPVKYKKVDDDTLPF